jgi:hypothetical protein
MRRLLAWGLLGCLAAACPATQPPEHDTLPPWVTEFSPPGDGAPPGSEVSVTFSEPIRPEAVLDGLVVLVPEESLDDGFFKDFNTPPLTKARLGRLVPVEARLEEAGRRVRLTPAAPLRAGGAYWLVVSSAVNDRAGNPLVAEPTLDERGRTVGVRSHAAHRFQLGHPPVDEDGWPADGGERENSGHEVAPAGWAVRISEVLANPAGDEAAGEYLEVVAGAQGLELEGLRLSDEGEEGAGESLEACAPGEPTWLPPGGVALIVGRSFRPPAELPPGTLRVCNPRDSLTPRGLRNSGGEVLVLKDVDGHALDRFGGWLDFSRREGCGARRSPLGAPDAPEAWSFPAGEPCATPGWLEPGQLEGP